MEIKEMSMSELQIQMQALLDRGLEVGEALTVMANLPIRRCQEELVEAARDLYQSDEIQIDVNAIISEIEGSDYEMADGRGRVWGHSWVQAWVLVPDYEVDSCLNNPDAFSVADKDDEDDDEEL